MAFTQIVVVGSYKTQAGTAASGYIDFRLSAQLLDSATNEIRAPIPTRATLSSGTISTSLVATNDPTSLPAGATYVVNEFISGSAPKFYSFVLPYNTTTLYGTSTFNLADA